MIFSLTFRKWSYHFNDKQYWIAFKIDTKTYANYVYLSINLIKKLKFPSIPLQSTSKIYLSRFIFKDIVLSIEVKGGF